MFSGLSKISDLSRNRVLGLDILRSIAILIVVYSHGLSYIPRSFHKFYYVPMRLIPDGVSIFFVLSGFLIGTILLKVIHKTEFKFHDLLSFWIRRWFRTLPNYYLILLILLSYNIFILGDISHLYSNYFLFLQNFNTHSSVFFNESWSLSVEEWFYLLFPACVFLLFMILKNKKRSIVIGVIFFMFFSLMLRIIKYTNGAGLDNINLGYRWVVTCRLDSLMFGILGAYLSFYFNDLWKKYRMISMVFCLFLILLMYGLKFFPIGKWYHAIVEFDMESIATLLALPLLSEIKNSRYRSVTIFFTLISIISYSMYLINLSLIHEIILPKFALLLNSVNFTFVNINIILYLFFWIFTIGLSALLYYFYEKPIMDLRDKTKFRLTLKAAK